MKFFLTLLILAGADTVRANQYQCGETALDADRLEYAVVVDVPNHRQQAKVRVSLFGRRNRTFPYRPMRPTFEAAAQVQSSVLRFDTLTTHGVRLDLNLNPAVHSLMELRWVTGDIELKCKVTP